MVGKVYFFNLGLKGLKYTKGLQQKAGERQLNLAEQESPFRSRVEVIMSRIEGRAKKVL